MSTIRVYNTNDPQKRGIRSSSSGEGGHLRLRRHALQPSPILAMLVLSLCGTLSIASLNMKAMM